MKILYFGDGGWAVDCLKLLRSNGHDVVGVVERSSPSDNSLGRYCAETALPTYRPDDVNDSAFVEWVRSLQVDLNLSMSYDQILKRPILESAAGGFINCHAGKLPNYRGRNVINWAIINNEQEVGLTVHYVGEGIDTGDIIVQNTVPIGWEDTYATMLDRTRRAFPGLLAEAVAQIESGQVNRTVQSDREGSYFAKRRPGDEWIDWADCSLNIYNKIRAITQPGPGARTTHGRDTIILWRATYDPEWPKYLATPGEVVGRTPGVGVRVKTGDSTIELTSIGVEGERGESVPRYRVGTRFGEIGRQGRPNTIGEDERPGSAGEEKRG